MTKLETIARAFGVITTEKFSGDDELRGLIAKRANDGERLASDFRRAHPRMFSLQPAQIPIMQTFPPPAPRPAQPVQRDPNAPIVVNCDLHGAGDAVVMAWIAQGADGKLRLYATGAKRALLEAFGQPVLNRSDGAMDTFAAYAVETKARGSKVRVQQRGAFLGIATQPVRPTPRLRDEDRAFADSLGDNPVLLYPGCDDGTREWPPFYWLDLYERLAAAGMNPHLLCRDPDYRYSSLPTYHEGRTWPENMHAMLAARVVVGNDSGPMHVAGTLDVPMIALLGPTTCSMCCHMPSVIPLQASEEEIFCVGCWHNTPEFRPACRYGCAALGHILPKTVFETIERTP